MSDLVKKLREYSDFAVSYGHEEACLLHVDAEEAADHIEALEAEVARLREADGLVIVPREPNDAMIEAAVAAWSNPRDIWEAMVEAALTPPAPSPEPGP